MNDGDVPETLFKYRSLEEPFGRRTVQDVVLRQRIFWQNPLQFNDPLDCNPVYYFGDTVQEREAFHRRGISTQFADLPRAERRRALRDVRRRPVEFFEQRAREGFRDSMEESAVCCLSAVPDNILMWAHYANSHRGICFKFCGPVTAEWVPFPVSYSPERPRINLTKLREIPAMQNSVLLKSQDWSYEQEFRMIDYRGGAGYRDIPRGYLKGVILGARISDEDEEFVRTVCAERPEIELERARIHDTEFRVEIGPAD